MHVYFYYSALKDKSIYVVPVFIDGQSYKNLTSTLFKTSIIIEPEGVVIKKMNA